MPDALLGGLTPQQFLDDYWQQKPLLVRGALPGWRSPLPPDELAGLACEDDATARIVLERGGAYPWELRYGPFDPDDFAELPAQDWTLLVQEVDRLVPDVAALLERFRFVPNWRLDDVMVSYAPAGGGVGAHIDHYDVFLIQGLGRRRWRIGAAPERPDPALVPDLDVAVLADFEAGHEYVLEPGDMLYLPPLWAHEGTALDDCMTYSVGFRAPSSDELATAFLEDLALEGGGARYGDPGLRAADDPGRLDAEALARLRALLRAGLADDDALDAWLGQYLTRPRRDVWEEGGDAPGDLVEALRAGGRLRRGPLHRLAYRPHGDGGVTLFAAGDAIELGPDLAPAASVLAGRGALDAATLGAFLAHPQFGELLEALARRGCLHLDDA